ncbi:hypothetical protein FRC12_022601 [Ceratobasidium sp. 428]|nr:hypothetical protein FRC12_022601 [Ceratobasidium sp. 428]
MRMPKGLARKSAPKYVGQYKVSRVITPGASYEVELQKDMRARGIHPVFHASLLRVHSPLDDQRFPGREYGQVPTIGDSPQERAVNRITGDRTWELYRAIRHLEALDTYCEAHSVTSVGKLSPGQ